jgi:hypothetical protein
LSVAAAIIGGSGFAGARSCRCDVGVILLACFERLNLIDVVLCPARGDGLIVMAASRFGDADGGKRTDHDDESEGPGPILPDRNR